MKSQDKRVTNKVQKVSAKSAFTPLLPPPPLGNLASFCKVPWYLLSGEEPLSVKSWHLTYKFPYPFAKVHEHNQIYTYFESLSLIVFDFIPYDFLFLDQLGFINSFYSLLTTE